MDYVDVRGVCPIYFNGFKSFRLPFYARNWSMEAVRDFVENNYNY